MQDWTANKPFIYLTWVGWPPNTAGKGLLSEYRLRETRGIVKSWVSPKVKEGLAMWLADHQVNLKNKQNDTKCISKYSSDNKLLPQTKGTIKLYNHTWKIYINFWWRQCRWGVQLPTRWIPSTSVPRWMSVVTWLVIHRFGKEGYLVGENVWVRSLTKWLNKLQLQPML